MGRPSHTSGSARLRFPHGRVLPLGSFPLVRRMKSFLCHPQNGAKRTEADSVPSWFQSFRLSVSPAGLPYQFSKSATIASIWVRSSFSRATMPEICRLSSAMSIFSRVSLGCTYPLTDST